MCTECAKERDFNEEELNIIKRMEEKYNIKFDLKGKKTYDAVGCKHCNQVGYLDRVGIFEVLQINDEIKELISNDESPIKIKKAAQKYGYEPLEIDGMRKVIDGITNMPELNKKLLLK